MCCSATSLSPLCSGGGVRKRGGAQVVWMRVPVYLIPAADAARSQPVPEKMGLEMVVAMEIMIIAGLFNMGCLNRDL